VNNGATTYTYDAEGRRVAKTTGASVTDFIYDREGHVILDTTPSPADSPLGELYVAGMHLGTYVVNSALTDTIFYYDHSDWLGTERARTNPSGIACETIQSLPFGDGQVINSTCGDVSPLHFTGKERDAESGNDYFGARYYASTMGRFLTPDSARYSGLSDPQSLNLYSYVGNHPTFLIDPDGRCWQWAQKLCDAAKNAGQRFDNLFHGEGFRTDQGVENYAHQHNAERRQQEVNGSTAGRLGQRYGEFHRNWDRWWAAHDCEGAMGGCGLAPSLASLGVYTRPTRTLFRAVSRAEFEDIQKTGKFSASPGGAESKYFYPTLEQAEKMGGRMYGEDYGVVVGNFPESAMEGPFSVATEGDVFTVPTENLELARPAVEVPLEPEIPE
jgi:RHS repeat-associated protein